MKPHFALTLSVEGIALLHHAASGWHEIGAVAFDDPDLTTALAMLRSKGDALVPAGVTCKLVLPDDQIKYLSVPHENRDPSFYESMAHQALAGKTPYDLSELAVTWHVDGDRLQVAAVARETLAEAESFAHQYEFNPVSFVAIPSDEDFAIEPFFGATHAETQLLGGPVSPDLEKIVVVKPDVIPSPTASLAATTSDVPQTEPAEMPAEAAPQEPAANAPIEPPVVPAITEITEIKPAPTIPPAPAAEFPKIEQIGVPAFEFLEPPVDYDEIARRAEAELGPAAPLSAAELEMAKAVETPRSPAVVDPVAPNNAPPLNARGQNAAVPPAPAPLRAGADPLQRSAKAAPSAARHQAEDLPPTPTFSTVRAQRDLSQSNSPPLIGANRSAEADSGEWKRTPPEGLLSSNNGAENQDHNRPQPIFPFAEIKEGDPEAAMLAQADSLRPEMSDAALEDAPSEGLFSRRAPPQNGAAPQPMPEPKDENQRLGIFDTAETAPRAVLEKTSKSTIGGKPRYLGLILTALLLFFLVGVAAYASFSQEGLAGLFNRNASVVTVENTGPTATEIAEGLAKARAEILGDAASAETEPAILPNTEAPPTEDPEDLFTRDTEIAALSTGPMLRPSPLPLPADPDSPTALPQQVLTDQGTQSDLANDPELQEEPDLPEATETPAVPLTTKERYAATGIWQQAPQPPVAGETATLDDLYVASIDDFVPQTDAVALPNLLEALSDQLPASQNNPVDPATKFNFDQRGLVAATPEGAVSPDGIKVIRGRPKIRPTSWPERVAPAPDGLSPEQRKILSTVRPKLRPGDLVEKTERIQLGGRTRTELALLRPKLRPREFIQNINPDSLQSGIQNGVQQALLQSTNGPLIDLDGNATDGDVSDDSIAAIAPRPRPDNFAKAVQQARATPATATTTPRNSAPSIPSSASVARQATIKNQLNLRKVNLIGIYGQPSSRRALVRMANGEYKKVKVGDRIDGGKIAAISESELHYVKSGRSVVLKMPRG